MKLLRNVLWIVAFIADCSDAIVACPNDRPCLLRSSRALRFSVLGDMGGWETWPYFSYAQVRVAEKLGRLARQRKTHFQIALGDNFYKHGVANVSDPRFQKTFEDIYSSWNSYLSRPWHVIAGNHDHYGNTTAQIAYSRRSKRWSFPSLFYKFSYKFGLNTSVDFVMIDTTVLCGNIADNDADNEPSTTSFFKNILFDKENKPQGPENASLAEKRWIWVEEQLKKSRANYLFVAGHYPVYSAGNHGPTKCLLDRLRPLLHKFRVTAYLSAHDHNVQYLVEPNDRHPAAPPVQYIVSGAASKTDASAQNAQKLPAGILKFQYPKVYNPFGDWGFSNGAFVYIELNEKNGVMEVHGIQDQHKYRALFDGRNETPKTREHSKIKQGQDVRDIRSQDAFYPLNLGPFDVVNEFDNVLLSKLQSQTPQPTEQFAPVHRVTTQSYRGSDRTEHDALRIRSIKAWREQMRSFFVN